MHLVLVDDVVILFFGLDNLFLYEQGNSKEYQRHGQERYQESPSDVSEENVITVIPQLNLSFGIVECYVYIDCKHKEQSCSGYE
jgi:hypothetical protein